MTRRFVTFTLLLSFCLVDAVPAFAQSTKARRSEVTKEFRPPLNKCWDHFFDAGAGGFVAGAGDTIFISEENGKLRAVSAGSSETVWVSELGGSVQAVYASSSFGVFVLTASKDAFGSSTATLRKLEFDTGLPNYSVPALSSGAAYLELVGSRVILISRSGYIEAFEADSGVSIWKAKASGPISSIPAVHENTIAISTGLKTIEFFSVLDGSMTSSFSTDHEVKTLAFRSNRMLLAGDERGNVMNFRDQTGAVWWRFKSGARVGSIVETDEGILVGSFDNFVYLISKYSGDVKWKRRLEGRVNFRPIVLGNELIVTVSGSDEFVVLDIDKGRVLGQIPLGAERFPTADPIQSNAALVFPVAGGLVGYSSNGCK